MTGPGRRARYGEVSAALALLSDERLTGGFTGATTVVEVAGEPVFVKRIPMTELELANVRSTANLFGLPAHCHYGVGAPPFGAWRELAANAMATGWVIGGRTEAFPLLYHWRVLPGAAPLDPEFADVERVVDHWHGAPQVRRRLEALAAAPASLLLFLEYVPHTLRDWLPARFAAGPAAAERACAMVERHLRDAVAFMNGAGLLHFDAHFGNVLTDGERLYLADLGLAASPRFELTAAESDLVARNATHDAGHSITQLVNCAVTHGAGIDDVAARNAYIRRCAGGAAPDGVPPGVAALIARHAPVAAVVNDFYWSLFGESRLTPYPAEAVARALA